MANCACSALTWSGTSQLAASEQSRRPRSAIAADDALRDLAVRSDEVHGAWSIAVLARQRATHCHDGLRGRRGISIRAVCAEVAEVQARRGARCVQRSQIRGNRGRHVLDGGSEVGEKSGGNARCQRVRTDADGYTVQRRLLRRARHGCSPQALNEGHVPDIITLVIRVRAPRAVRRHHGRHILSEAVAYLGV